LAKNIAAEILLESSIVSKTVSSWCIICGSTHIAHLSFEIVCEGVCYNAIFYSFSEVIMKLFIDGEWNSYRGDLISMALVPIDGSDPFYEVLECDKPDPWVKEHVMPKLYNLPITREHFWKRLEKFLMQYDEVEVIADWPEDISYFCNALITGPGTRINTPPLFMRVIRIDTVSKDPHNALADATALRDWFIAFHCGY
jgi:hypothetical protein